MTGGVCGHDDHPSLFNLCNQARHAIHFDFSHGASSGRAPPQISLTLPPSYSAETQMSSRGWHFPARPNAEEWLCAPFNRSTCAPACARGESSSMDTSRERSAQPQRGEATASAGNRATQSELPESKRARVAQS